MKKIITSWSGGKDSCYAMMEAVRQGLEPIALMNMMNENGEISRSHAIPLPVLKEQASMMGLPLSAVPTTWADYEKNFTGTLTQLVKLHNASGAVFGDIDFEDNRAWEEKVCNSAGIECYLPLWKEDRKQLVQRMINSGIKTMIVSCNNHLGESFLGKIIDQDLIVLLEEKGVDVCGENGEYHTLVINCPLFKHSIAVTKGKKICHNNYWFQETFL